MKESRIIYLLLGLFVLGVVGSYYAGYRYGKNKQQVIYKEIIKEVKQIDTLKVIERIIRSYPKIDTLRVIIRDRDTIYLDKPQLVAKADTSVTLLNEKDTLDLRINYYFPPINQFQLDINYKKYISTSKQRWTDNFGVMFGWSAGYDPIARRIFQGPSLTIGIKIK